MYSSEKTPDLDDIERPVSSTEPAPRLLIVDDVEDNRTVLARRFARRGFHITEADGGRAALALVDQQQFDLVLLDIMMPDILGTEVLRVIRSKHNAVSLPVIMVTARSMSDDVVEALQLGANDYITKPVDFAIAIARVNTQIARRKAEMQMLRAAEELFQSKEALEERVRERTSDLMRINEQLKEEIVQRERSEAETRFLALHDGLTGLANRVLFGKALTTAINGLAPDAQAAVLFIDLDGFKGVNDTLGHHVGDQLLRLVAERLTTYAPTADIISRLGGDEFAILLPAPVSEAEAGALAELLVARISEPVLINGSEVAVGASVGIAMATSPGPSVEDLLRCADLAMYRAKSAGRGTWRLYDAGMDEAAQAHRKLELELRHALSMGHFRVYFQPIVDLQKLSVTTFEALLRWEHATRGLIAPEDFIGLAEETKLIIPIGEWMIAEACRQAAKWPNGIRVAVNLSPTQILRGNIIATVKAALALAGLAPERLELEVTEAVLAEDADKALAILQELRLLGIRISMDDFGIGYSTLSHMRSFPFDKIKIDRSFMEDVEDNPETKAIVQAVARIGAQLGVTTTVEGVETAAQLGYVTQEGCVEVQGKLFSMPVPAGEVGRILEQIRTMKS